jgi:ribosome-associated translation inhibitor RaiA
VSAGIVLAAVKVSRDIHGRIEMTLVMEGIALDDPLRPFIQEKLTATLRHGRLRPTLARVAFTDENGPKGGVGIRCTLTVDLPRRPGTHARGLGATPRLAFDTAYAALEQELTRERQRRRDVARRPKKYFVAELGHTADGEPALPPVRRRRRSA